MNHTNITAFWHKTSFDRLMQERLPQLLAERLPLADYQYESSGEYRCQVCVTISSNGTEIETRYVDLPQPDAEGIYRLDGGLHTIVPIAEHEALDQATVQCGGEMIFDFIAERLGTAPADLPWTETLLRTWLPLDKWLAEFMRSRAQWLDTTNWLAQRTHLRRLSLTTRRRYSAAGQIGRTCPFENPEGPNLGRIFSLALGAAIQDGKVVILRDSPEAGLGLTASLIPCLEHDDPNRLLMGANMMRQWVAYAQPEPALVQTGNEPAPPDSWPDVWCGRNLLTAFIPWGGDSYEDGIILSESGARRLTTVWQAIEHPVEPGDKLSNRHGFKGVVSRILPDAQMPRLPDGTPVELIFSGIALPGRQNIGQLWEAALGRLARAEGSPVIAPPFHGPSEEEVRRRLAAVGLPDDGLEQVFDPETSKPLAGRSTVGWLYWGCTHHFASDKLEMATESGEGMQHQGELDAQILLEVGAMETMRQHFHARQGDRETRRQEDKETARLTARLSSPKSSPKSRRQGEGEMISPRFEEVRQRVAAMGIEVTVAQRQVRCQFVSPVERFASEQSIRLARPLPHPWLSERLIDAVGAFPAQATEAAYLTLREANDKLARLLKSKTPDVLVNQAQRQVEVRLQAYAAALLSREHLYFDSQVPFSAQSVLAPGPKLRYDQIGLAEEMVWTLFGPQLARELGDEAAVTQRTPAASRQLDALLARSWVIVNRAPSLTPTSMIAFHPVRDPGRVIRLPLPACRPLDGDFDGDQAAIYLPLTDEGQDEAGRLLSLAGHLTRDPGLIHELAPSYEAMWGLTQLSRQPTGLSEIEAIVGVALTLSEPFVTRAGLIQALEKLLATQGVEQVLTVVDQLFQRGLAVTQGSGLSLSPFIDTQWKLPPAPATTEPNEWQRYHEQVIEQLLACAEFDHGVGPYVLAVKCGAVPVGYIQTLAQLLGVIRPVIDINGQSVAPLGGYRQGLSSASFWQLIPGAREGLGRLAESFDRAMNDPYSARQQPREEKSFHLLARARRARTPGIVFARAAAMDEVDPLVDVESRMFVGV